MQPEDHRTEYKLKLTDQLEKEVVGFLNTREGGTLYIGISDDGQVVGVDEIDAVQRKVIDRIRNNIVPPTMGLFEVTTETQEQRAIIKIVILSGPEKPYYIRPNLRVTFDYPEDVSFSDAQNVMENVTEPLSVAIEPEKVAIEPEKVAIEPGKVAIEPEKVAIEPDSKKIGSKKFQQQEAIMDFLKGHEFVTNSDVVELTGIKAARARIILGEMCKAGMLEAKGDKRYRYYKLKK